MNAQRRSRRFAGLLRAIQLVFSENAVKAFILIGLPTGLLFTFGTPPFYMLDEPNHYFRAYQISQGDIVAEKRDDKTGGVLPRSLAASVYVFRVGVQQYDDGHVPVELIKGALTMPLQEKDTSYVSFANTAMYSPVPYLPQTFGITIGRYLNLSPLGVMYLGRVFNLLFSIVLIAFAIHLVPAHRWVFMLIALSPTSMFQMASMSSDALTNALILLFIALVARQAFLSESEQINSRYVVLLAATGILLGFCKPIYVILPALIVLIPGRKFSRPWMKYALACGVLLAAVVPAGVWNAIAKDIYNPFMDTGANPSEAVAYSLGHPIQVLGILAQDLWNQGMFYLQGLVGIQWNEQNILLSGPFIALYYAIILATALFDTSDEVRIERWQRAILFVFLGSAVLLVTFAVYITWVPPGSSFIAGVQGRYFLPLLPLALLFLYKRWKPIPKYRAVAAILYPVFSFSYLFASFLLFRQLV
ncbi:MAG: hypothetical protein CL946_01550 [Ectothiorhodospiraceae bacterium]|nr:hypothetical protein [Ectothiorhodospiraceae bacterium]